MNESQNLPKDRDAQLRLELIAMHLDVKRYGSRWNFLRVLAIFFVAAILLLTYDHHHQNIIFFALVAGAFWLQIIYFVHVPRKRLFLAFFERHHPELCSWLQESAELEAMAQFEKRA